MNTLFIRALLVSSLLAPLAQAADESVASAPVASAPAASAPVSAPAAVVPSKIEVTKAIAVLESNFLGKEAPTAAKTVMLFAENSKEVTMALSPKTAPWIFGDKKIDNAAEENLRFMLLVAYVAGNMKAQLAAGKPVDSPLAGWQFALKAYKTIQQKNKAKISELETLKSQQSKGQLDALAKKALQN